ncbi:MAG: Sodium-dependent dicarboxylate transporter SdcS [candidate division WS2 bacterium]|uniref:Sodium-dependent dicarboxylate transporter SdcS n=1 Tax=Psychracetigena formicireducens TaxID=2986056 RepID=A0A9E2BH89_PSYF1|nr:Sodium-dependent dicarboxylate transporter SdcS [Candidatus Psychracetigena formicireducens]MBT9145518.1 Sodium-dependent dicarboxylate transporter SdcS [Candidatus Psychracetigena formicireducens]
MFFIKYKKLITIVLAIILGYVVYLLPIPDLPVGGRITLGILVIGAILWITEAIPLYSTSLLVLFLNLIFLARVIEVPIRTFISPFFDPVILLFLGGFALSAGLSKYGLDEIFTQAIVSRVGNSPRKVLLGIMAVVAFLSMWMSNTAATVLGMSLSLLIVKNLEAKDPFSLAMILGVPFAANIGGMATPIGTPPNAIAIGLLRAQGIELSFLRWMSVGLPLAIILFMFTYWILITFFKPKAKAVELKISTSKKLNKTQIITLVTFLITITFWLTGEWHKYDPAVGALIPAIVFTGLGILNHDDLGQLGWDVLLLIGGGLSLGVAIEKSGLSQWVVSQASGLQLNPMMVFIFFALFTITLTTFISNTVTASLIVPIGISLVSAEPTSIAIIIALSASIAMILPISTPPNAIAYSSGIIKVKDMAKVGTIIALFSAVILSTLGVYLIKLLT